MKMNRRSWIKSAAQAGIGLSAGISWPRRAKAEEATLPFVLTVYASGGWDQTMVFDNQLASPIATLEAGAAQRVATTGIRYMDHPNRPSVRTFFDTYGTNAAIINGISTGSMDRKSALKNIWGFTPPGRPRPTDWLSYFSAALNPVMDIPHAVLDAPYMPGENEAMAVKISKKDISDYLATALRGESLGTDGEEALLAFRTSIYGGVQKGVNPASLDSEKLRALFFGFGRDDAIKSRITTANQVLGVQGSDSDFLRSGKIAIELFASGASQCASLQAGRTELWDTTTNHTLKHSANFESLFSDLTKIFDYAATRGVLSQMLVVVVSERGRAPVLKDNGSKDPWPFTSAMVWGMGVSGRTVIQANDNAFRGIPINPVFGDTSGGTMTTLTMANLWAAIYLIYNAPFQLMMPKVIPLTAMIQVS